MRVWIKQKHRLKLLLLRIARIVMARPILKAGCWKVISLFPRVSRRLCRIVREDRMQALSQNMDFSHVSEDTLIQDMPEPVYQSYLFIKNTDTYTRELNDLPTD